jgi:hypothetical protein
MKKHLLFVAYCIVSASVAAQSKGDVYEGSIQVLDARNSALIFEVPLAPGKWSVENVVNRSSTGSANAALKDVRLIRVNNGILQEALEITAKVDNTNIRWNDEPCKVEPVLYKNDYGTRLWQQKCLTIMPRTFLQNDNEPTRAVLKDFSDRGIKHDFNSIGADYTRYGDYSKFLIIRHHLFPSNYGLDNPVVGILNTSPYHPSLISSNPDKKMFSDALAKYFEGVVVAYDAAYEGKPVQKIDAFVWPPADDGVSADHSQRFQLLKKAYSAGLLSKEEYDKKKSEMLSR